MEVSIRLEYRDKVYISDWDELTDGEIRGLRQLMEKIVGGECNYLTFKIQDQSIYIGGKVLQESIITISTRVK